MWPRRRARDQAWQRNEAGAIAIYVALMLPFLVGLALLVVDGGRLFNLDTSLQNNVDALALAVGKRVVDLDATVNAFVETSRTFNDLNEKLEKQAELQGKLEQIGRAHV